MIPILEPLVHLLRPIAVASLMAAVAAGLGTLARGRPRGEESRWVEAGLDLALGLALLSALGFWLGLAGCLRMGALVLGAALLAGLLFLIRPRASPRNGRGQGVPAGSSALGEPGWRLALPILALVALPLAVLALYPPTAFDPTLYHLPYARAFVATGGLPYLPDLRFPVFPQASEVLFAEAMLLANDRAAQLLSLVATLATAGILFSWARRAWGAEAGALAAGLFLGGPIVAYLSGTAYTEPLLVLFTAATFACLDRYLADEDPRRLAFAGFLAGTAAAVKYLGLFAVGAALLVAVSRGNLGARIRRSGLACAFAALAVAPWYARNAVYTGNPIFPLWQRAFGADGWKSPIDYAPMPGDSFARLADLAAIPWTLSVDRGVVGRMPPWSPAIWIACVVALAATRRDVRVRRLLAAAAAYLAAFLVLPIDARYLLPILPLLAVAGAGSLARLFDRRRPTLALALAVALLPGWLWSLYDLHRLGPLPTDGTSRERFLAARLPAYAALRDLERRGGASASVYAFYAENHAYYAPGRFQGDWSGPASFDAVLSAAGSGDGLADALERLGADHLLTVVAHEPPLPRDSSFDRRFRRVYDDGRARVWQVLPRPSHGASVRAHSERHSVKGR
ncbi:MAG TPA: glycosyltransferase family 39 protein [Thermoanaerobaculia bacterium]|nr:glycosyltransferase family 39 protein [Thermoanaerobaculia bacterium]